MRRSEERLPTRLRSRLPSSVLQYRSRIQTLLLKHLIRFKRATEFGVAVSVKDTDAAVKTSDQIQKSEENANMESGNFESAKYRKSRPNGGIRGTGGVSGNGFAVAERTAWLYVGNCKKESNIEDIREFLTKKFPNTTFEIEEILKRQARRNQILKIYGSFLLRNFQIQLLKWKKS
ncbi:hypothetical protein QE152_g4958 [Popillia japonica]|uniref:Uncharacterized protein n=1 Tax=Popillia japonica TaxID=7064 RepID=A0AAW1MYT7_POPJA